MLCCDYCSNTPSCRVMDAWNEKGISTVYDWICNANVFWRRGGERIKVYEGGGFVCASAWGFK